MLIVFLVIVLDLIGFGIMVPILAYYVVQLGGGPELATFCMALYAIGMLISTPILGRLSDFHGRRPILMLSMVGAIIGYLMLGFAESLWVVALSRLLAGLMAGNIAAAQAYITDITSEENRAKGMGLIGAAFGLGFVIGPALGSYLAGDDFATANLFLPAMVSAGMCAAAFVAIVFLLPESLDKEHSMALRKQPHPGRLTLAQQLWSRPLIPQFLVGVLIYNTGAGLVESIYPLWVRDTGIAMGPRDLMPLLLVSGVVLSVVQGGLIGPLTRAFGEHRLFQVGAIGFGLAMVCTVIAGGKRQLLRRYGGAVIPVGIGRPGADVHAEPGIAMCRTHRTRHGAGRLLFRRDPGQGYRHAGNGRDLRPYPYRKPLCVYRIGHVVFVFPGTQCAVKLAAT